MVGSVREPPRVRRDGDTETRTVGEVDVPVKGKK